MSVNLLGGKSGEPGRTRTCNPLIKSSLTDDVAKEDTGLSSAKRGKDGKKRNPGATQRREKNDLSVSGTGKYSCTKTIENNYRG